MHFSHTQPGGLVSQDLMPSLKKGVGSRGTILQCSSEHPCPGGRRGSAAPAAQERQRCANSRGKGKSHLAPGASMGTVLGSKRGHRSTSVSSLGAAAGAQPLPGTGWRCQRRFCLASKLRYSHPLVFCVSQNIRTA